MTTRTRPSQLALLALLASGCTVDSLLNQIENESEKTVDLACACDTAFPDKAMCEAQFRYYLNFFDRECVEDALKVDKKASKEALKCSLDNLKNYNDCLEDKLVCTDPMSFQSCNSFFEVECPELPLAVQTALQPCVPDDL